MASDANIFNVDPYYDDYSVDKKFLRTLFKPGYAVQARELTQLQTGLQKQIQKFGDNIFKDGSIVSESQVALNATKFVRVGSLTGYAGVSLTDFIGLTAAVSGKNTIRILDAVAGLSAGDTSPVFLFSDYLNGATGFAIGDTLSANLLGVTINATVTGGTSTFDYYSGAPSSLPAFGSATVVGLDSGVRYIKGFFVDHDAQTVTPYNVTGTYPNEYRIFNNLNSTVKFDVTDTIVTAAEDETLNDPAFGSYNYAAPGADRYRIDLTLTHVPYSATADYTLLQFQDGAATYKVNYPEYNVLADTLARRTYDESGNYTVDDFPISVDDHPTDETKVRVKIGKGKAYVFGYEFVNFANKTIDISKPRNYTTIYDQTFPIVLGNEVNLAFNPTLTATSFQAIDFNSSPLLYVSSTTASCSVIGTTRLGRFNAVDSGTQANLYELSLNPGFTAGAMKALFVPGYTATNQHVFYFSDIPAAVTKTSYNSLLFPMSNDITSYAVYDVSAQQFVVQRAMVKKINNGDTLDTSDFASEFGVGGAWNEFQSLSALKIYGPTGTNVTYTATHPGGNSDQLQFSSLSPSGITATIFANILVDENTAPRFERTKTSTTVTANVLMARNTYEEFAYLNGVTDVYSILSITGQIGGLTTSMTSYFNLDTGQRDDIYDWSRIVVKPEYTSQGITGVSVTYKKFAHGSGVGPFTIRSYDTSGISGYKEIPVYAFQGRSGKVVSLGGCYDFRPDRITPGSFGITSTPSAYGATGPSVFNDSEIRATWSYYLPRTDKLILTKDKEFAIITGVETEQAPAPDDRENAMTIGTMFLSPFTKTQADVQKFLVKNRRYTMKDIGKIDKRVDRLEYYTTLSLQEKEAKSLEIKDVNGLNKFKNGIFVDDFTSRANSSYNNYDHQCSVDPERKEIRPRFVSKYIDFGVTGGIPAGLTQTNDGLIMANYTNDLFISQKLASKAINVNPFDVFNFNGSLTLSPSSDDWIDVTKNPSVLVNLAGENSGISDLDTVDLGTVWNNWQTNWSGVYVGTSSWNLVNSTPAHSALSPDGLWRQQNTYAQYTTFSNSQSRTGLKTTLSPETVTKNLGDRVVDVSVIPYMRANTITITARGMRPNVRVYPFFDGTDVSAYCTVNGVPSAAITTDSEGRVGFASTVVFNLPAGIFKTGERLFRLIDSTTNDVTGCSTTADYIYRAQGLLKTEESTVVSTRSVNIRRENVREENIFNNVTTQTAVEWVDPVAQTFYIDPVSNPTGIFVSKIGVYFKSKAAALPINLQIRPTVNGYPSSSVIVPFSETYLAPASVNVSDDGSSVTYFTFSSPVYLQPGEHAIVLISNSNEYEVWVSEVGQNDSISGEKITSQPYAGSLFKSQNSSTWTAEQALDLKFDIYSCVFATTPATVVFDFIETDFDSTLDHVSNGANIFNLNATYIAPPTTNVSSSVQFESGGVMETAIPVINGQNFVFATKKPIVDTNSDRIVANFTLSTSDSNVSPVLDTERVSGLYIQNLLYLVGTPAYKDLYEQQATVRGITDSINLGSVRYVSKKINLQEGFDSDSIDVYLTARLPIGSDLRVYMKSQAPTDHTVFDNVPYEKLTIHPDYAIAYGSATGSSQYVSGGDDDYVDLRFIRGSTSSYFTSGQTGQGNFDSFQIKVALYGNPDNSVVPAFKDLKVVAT